MILCEEDEFYHSTNSKDKLLYTFNVKSKTFSPQPLKKAFAQKANQNENKNKKQVL